MSHEKILVVDDEPYIVHILSMKLTNAGYDVVTASDGDEGLDIALQEKPDLIITDFQMPYGDGLSMCREYRQQARRDIPAMLITAREFDIEEPDLADTGIQEVLPKPFSPRQVLESIQQLLGQSQDAAGASNKHGSGAESGAQQ